MLLRKATWHEAWRSLKRAHKDRRARKHFLLFLLHLLIPFLCIAWLAAAMGTGFIFLVPLILLFGWWRSRAVRKEDSVSLSIKAPTPPIHRKLTEEDRQKLRRYFTEQALIYAVVTDRAGSEAFLKEKILPEGVEVVSRRIHLDLLKTHGLWDKMSSNDRQAMMMTDGHWQWPLINQTYVSLEPLRLLRWILRIDYYLPVVGQQLHMEVKLANEIVRNPAKVIEGEGLISQAQIEIGSQAARQFLIRCIAEEITRGYRQVDEGEDTQWATDYTTALSGKQHEDFVLGSKLVSEATQEELQWATVLARTRMNFLNWAISLMNDPTLAERSAESNP
ncbi:intracellular growth attenuator family protein [Acidicapsa ligni]|uniref:intracellular growth attenuator family protein n=1 Tax=Acidicapsa ligni TaxID=542300 RepID=UPI0021DF9B7A|nr:intracellular growth attenuator family protein [Acidicapsa ligni]